MINPKEMLAIAIAIIILAFSNSLKSISEGNSEIFAYSIIFFAIIFIVYIAGKKLMANYLESEEETKILTFQRYGLYERSYLKTPFPIGIILSFALSIFSLGYIRWFAVTETEVKSKIGRAVRKHEYYSYSEMTEFHIASISAAGISLLFVLSFIAYLINQPELAKLSVYFAAFNLLPLGKLDGTRIFFGARILYAILSAIALIALGYVWLLV